MDIYIHMSKVYCCYLHLVTFKNSNCKSMNINPALIRILPLKIHSFWWFIYHLKHKIQFNSDCICKWRSRTSSKNPSFSDVPPLIFLVGQDLVTIGGHFCLGDWLRSRDPPLVLQKNTEDNSLYLNWAACRSKLGSSQISLLTAPMLFVASWNHQRGCCDMRWIAVTH